MRGGKSIIHSNWSKIIKIRREIIMKAKKIIAVLLTVAMSISLGACGSSKEKDETSVSSENVNEEFPLKEKVKLSVLMIQAPYYGDMEQNTVLKELEEATNVELDLTLVPEEAAKERLTMTLAGGDYPDIIVGGFFGDSDLEEYGVNEKILIPLNDLIEEYGTNITERLSEHPEWKEDMTASDGNIYGIPHIDSEGKNHGNCYMKTWINTDWLKAVGKDMPTTTEEFREVLEAFKSEDPNGNGVADEIPFTGGSSALGVWGGDPYLYLLNAFGYFDENYYYLKDGKINSILDQDYIKEGLMYIGDLYENGLIDPAAFTQDLTQLAAVGNNEGDAIVGVGACGHVGMLVDMNDTERYSPYEIMMPLKGPDGYCGIPYTKEITASGSAFSITDQCENPEIAMRIANLLHEEEWIIRAQIGIQGEYWDYAEEGDVGADGKTPAKYKFLPAYTESMAKPGNDILGNTWRGIEVDWRGMFAVEGDIKTPENYESRLRVDTLKLEPYAADVDRIPKMTYAEGDQETVSQIRTAVKDYASNAFVEFITGKRDIEKDWDAYLAELEQLRYYDMLDLIQKTYDAQ